MYITKKSNVELIDHMGSDLTVVNVARVSFNKTSEEFSDKDAKLIRYLAQNNHWSPFAHCSASFRISAPIFVARQLVKHQVGLSWNEVSRRYVSDAPVIYIPDEWRLKAANVKQGSSEEVFTGQPFPIYDVLEETVKLYEEMLIAGICPEQARMVLPQSMMTEWIWTGSLHAFSRVCKQRLDSHAQKETREVAEAIDKHMSVLYPVSWNELKEV